MSAADRRVLVVDDNALNRRLASVLLEAAGLEVKTAQSGEEGLRIIEEFRPRVVLLDLNMPGMDGVETARRLKSGPHGAEVAVLAFTAESADAALVRWPGCDGCIPKPVDVRTFADQVKAHLPPALRDGSP